MSLLRFYPLIYFFCALLLGLSSLFVRGRDHKYPEMRLLRYSLIWTLLCLGLSLSLNQIQAKMILHEAKFIGLAFLPTLSLALYLRLAGRKLSRLSFGLLNIIPLISMSMAMTNPLHHLFRSSITVQSVSGLSYVNPVGSYFYWIHTAYSFAMIIAATAVLFWQLIKTPLFYRGRSWIFFACGLSLIAAGIFTTSHIVPDYGDMVLLMFVPIYFMQYYALFLYQPNTMIQLERATVINSIEDSVLFFGINGRLMDANVSAFQRHGIQEQDLGVLTVQDFLSRILGSSVSMNANFDHVELSLAPPYNGNYVLTDKQVLDSKKRYTGRVLMLHEVTEMKRTMSELEHTMSHDALTGLLIRQEFYRRAEIVGRLDQESHFVNVGINNMKLINTVFGFAFGDTVIRFVAQQIEELCPPQGLCARVGGDEFLIMLPNYSLAQARGFARQLTEACAVSRQFFLTITLSTGCGAMLPHTDIETAIQASGEDKNKRRLFKTQDSKSLQDGLAAALVAKGIARLEQLKYSGELCRRLALAAGCTEEEATQGEQLAYMADIGLLSLNEELNANRGHLSNEEWTSWKLHVEKGAKIARQTPSLHAIAEEILTHHERYDGLGYPHRLRGEDIPLLTRIYSICTAYAAWAEEAEGPQAALEKLQYYAGRRFDPYLIELFSALDKEKPLEQEASPCS